jgi:hypothetical protein
MKVCPVCKESFPDEMNFCDVDGTRLQRDASSPPGHNRLWSLLGVGLLIGALVISAMSIVFLPKSRVSPTVVSSEPPRASTSTKPAPEQAVSDAQPAATAAEPEIVVTEGPPPDAKKKDKALKNANASADALVPNPKAAAQASEEGEQSAQKTSASTPAAPAASPTPEPPAVKPVSERRETEAAPKPAPTTTEVKKDPKRQTTNSREAAKESDKKKKEEKKGGFFKVFKKIFGKD